MTTVIGKKTKAGFSALAVLLFGMAMSMLKIDPEVGYVLFALTAIVVFFALIIDIPAVDLPEDLKDLKKDLENLEGVADLSSLLKDHEAIIERLLEELTAGKLTMVDIEKMLDSPQVLAFISAVMKAIESGTPLDKINFAQLASSAMKA